MTQTSIQAFAMRDILVRAAAFVVLTTASTALLALPYLGTVNYAPEDEPGLSARLERAFQATEEIAAQRELMEALSAAVRKADRLSSEADCGAQTWPHIHPRCLGGAEAPGSAQPVRTVTVEYRLGESSSALVRLPVRRLASQP